MNFKFISILAFKYFKSSRSNRFISVISTFSLIGVIIGVAALIVVMSVMNGFHAELTNNIIGGESDVIVRLNPQNLEPETYNQIIQKISDQTYVTSAIATIDSQAIATNKDKNIDRGVIVKAFENDKLQYKSKIFNNVILGSSLALEEKDQILIGDELARILNVSVGDDIYLISPSTNSTIMGSIPRAKNFVIGGVFSSGIYEYDHLTILMSLNMAQKFFGMKDRVNKIEIYTNDHNKAMEYSWRINKLLDYNYSISNWQIINKQFLDTIVMERSTMFLILTLIIIVAAFNIVSSLFMLVKEKTKDIGILRTMGASRQQILMIFILIGCIIGFLGTFFGVMLGLVLAYNIDYIRIFFESNLHIKFLEPAIYFLQNLPCKIENADVIFASSISSICCLIATIYPAYKAASLDPVKAMKYE